MRGGGEGSGGGYQVLESGETGGGGRKGAPAAHIDDMHRAARPTMFVLRFTVWRLLSVVTPMPPRKGLEVGRKTFAAVG